jgi:hypothetical protein
MQAVGATSLPPPSESKRGSFWLIILLLLAGIASVFYFGSVDVHEGNQHLLYDSFDLSPEHAKLLKQLRKSRLSILRGRKEDGLFQFADHFSNQLLLTGRTVFLENVGQ